MGFYLVELQKSVSVHPRFFNAKIQDHVVNRLMSEVEGTTSGRFGFIVAVIDVPRPLPAGKLQAGTGAAVYALRYKALVFRPFRGEVLDGVVASLTRHGVFVSVAPLSVFVSAKNVPSDMLFDEAEQCYVSTVQQGEDRIEVGTPVRMRVVGMRNDVTEIAAVGTLNADYLGPLQ